MGSSAAAESMRVVAARVYGGAWEIWGLFMAHGVVCSEGFPIAHRMAICELHGDGKRRCHFSTMWWGVRATPAAALEAGDVRKRVTRGRG